MKRIINAFKVGWWAYQNPYALQESNCRAMSDVMKFIMKVAEEEKPYLTHIGFIHAKEYHQIVSLWAGAGEGATPIKRISELVDEINKLKALQNKQ